jgi:hypothetical protein
MAIATLRVRRRIWKILPYCRFSGVRHPENALLRARLFDTTSARNAAMEENYRRISRGALARTEEISDRAIFWGMIFTVLVVVAGMIRGLFG